MAPCSKFAPRFALFLFVLWLSSTGVHAQARVAAARASTPTASSGPLPCNLPTDKIFRPECRVQGADTVAGATGQQGDLWQKIMSVALPDAQYAKALADAAGTPGAKLRSDCLGAIIGAIQQASGSTVLGPDGKPLPEPSPALITGMERAAELIDNLQPTAPIPSKCAPAAQAAGMNALAFVNTLVTGLAIKAAVPIP